MTLRRKVNIGLRVFLIITVLTIIVIMTLTLDKRTWASLKDFKIIYLALCFVLWGLYITMDGLRVQILSSALGKRISIKTAISVITSGLFLAAVTPFQTGGLPVQLYILKKEDISIGKGSVILLFRGILELFIFIFVVPLIFFYYKGLLTGKVTQALMRYLFIIYGIGIFLLIILILNPKIFKKVLYRFYFFLKRRRIVKTKRLLRLFRRLFVEVEDFRKSLRAYFSRQKLKLLLAFFVTIISYISLFLIAPIMLLGLGEHPPILETIYLQLILKFLLFFVPTPGASGVSEAAFVSLFKRISPVHLLGVYVVLWRFFTFYIGAAIGGFVIIRMLQRGEEEEIEKYKKKSVRRKR
ncbi:flippase-like domain-containing protein [candidate division WOR-3 bacterium]|nr:flippase-like domain-containing protein [candidate division WOR-3 bacterium]